MKRKRGDKDNSGKKKKKPSNKLSVEMMSNQLKAEQEDKKLKVLESHLKATGQESKSIACLFRPN